MMRKQAQGWLNLKPEELAARLRESNDCVNLKPEELAARLRESDDCVLAGGDPDGVGVRYTDRQISRRF